MRHAHGACIGAFGGQRFEFLFTRHQQILLQFRAEKFRPFGIAKGECFQCFHNGIAAGILPIESLDADNGSDDVRWHTISFLCLFQLLVIFAHEFFTILDALRLEKNFAVLIPWHCLGRAGHRLDDGWPVLGFLQLPRQLSRIKLVLLNHLCDKLLLLL